MSDEIFERTILNLNILGSLREQDRLYSSSNYGLDVSGPSKLSCLYRSYYGENRKQNIGDVKDILSTAFTLIESLLNKEEFFSKENSVSSVDIPRRRYIEQTRTQQKLNRLERALGDACKGIQNWAKTYEEDIKTVHSIQTIVSNVEDYIEQINISKKIIITHKIDESCCHKCRQNLHSGDINSPCEITPIQKLSTS